jgi:hypothetical protein
MLLRSASLALLLLFGVGCIGRTAKLPIEYKVAKTLSAAEAGAVLSELRAQANQLRSLQSSSDVTIRKFPGAQDVEQVLIFDREPGFRLEVFEPAVHRLLALVVVANNKLTAIDLDRREVVVGQGSADNLERVLGIPFEMDQLAALFAGQFMLPASDGPMEIKKHPTVEEYLISSRLSERTECQLIVKKLSAGGWQLTRVLISDRNSDQLLAEARFSEHRPLSIESAGGGVIGNSDIYPRKVEFNLPQRQISSSLIYRQFTLNARIDPRRFEIRVPSRYSIRDLDLSSENLR